MVVLHPSGDVAKEVGRDEEGVDDAAAAIEAYEGELIRQADGEGNVVCEGEAEEENGGEESEEGAQEGYGWVGTRKRGKEE